VVGEDVESLREVVEDLSELDGVERVEDDVVQGRGPFEGLASAARGAAGQGRATR
jgi:hypothetical protein